MEPCGRWWSAASHLSLKLKKRTGRAASISVSTGPSTRVRASRRAGAWPTMCSHISWSQAIDGNLPRPSEFDASCLQPHYQIDSVWRETSNSVTEYDSGLVEFSALARVSCYAMTFTVDSRHVDRAAGRTSPGKSSIRSE